MRKIKFNLKEIFSLKTEKQFIKFIIIGVITGVIYILLLILLTEISKMHYLISALIAGIITTTINFTLNKTITFNENFEKKFFEEYKEFWIIRGISWPIEIIIIYALTEFIGLHYLISSTIALGITAIIKFLAIKFFMFKR